MRILSNMRRHSTANIDANLERFSATKPVETVQIDNEETTDVEKTDDEEIVDYVSSETVSFETPLDETQEVETEDVDDVLKTDFSKFEDFDAIEKSVSIPEVPQASALFNAIINKSVTENDDINADVDLTKELDDFMIDDKDVFNPHTSLNTVEEEPVLFPENDSLLFEENNTKEEPIVEPEISKPNFIDRVLGLSRARKNRKEQFVAQEPMTPKFSDDTEEISFSTDEELDNLDIPAFLRKK